MARRIASGILLAVALLLGGGEGVYAAELLKEDEVWSVVESPAFQVMGDASPEALTTIATNLETLRVVLSRLGGGESALERRRLPVVLFKNNASFNRFRPYLTELTRSADGFFTRILDLRFLTVVPGRHRSEVAYHEYIHHVVHSRLGEVPNWLDEGLAGVYETFTREDNDVVIGFASRDRVRHLSERTWVPLTELFRIAGAAGVRDHSDEASQARYPQSWLLTHYLLFSKPDRRQELVAFLDAVGRGDSHDEAFEASFSGGIAGVDEQLRAYVRGVIPFVTLKFDELEVTKPEPGRRVDHADVLAMLGEWLLTLGPEGRRAAPAIFEQALALQPEQLRAKVGLGYEAVIEGRSDDAAARLDPLIDAGHDSPGVLMIGAHLAHARAVESDSTEDLLRARQLARRAIPHMPDDVSLLVIFGSTFREAADDRRDAIAAVERAVTIDPRHAGALATLVQLHAADRDRAKALALMPRIEALGDAEVLSFARRAIAGLDVLEANAAAEAQEYDRAIELLRGARASIDNAEDLAMIDDALRRLEQLVAERAKSGR